MSNPIYHAKSSARIFGGVADDYIAIHQFFDSTKAAWADVRHRAILHSSFGIFLCEQVFGASFARASDGFIVATRIIGEQHVQEDLGRIPTIENWLEGLPVEPWMEKGTYQLARKFGADKSTVAAKTQGDENGNENRGV